MRKQFSNQEILSYAQQLSKVILNAAEDIELPVRVNFYLQKNIKTFLKAAQEINEMRLKIGKKYGEYDKETQSYQIQDKNKLELAQQDLKNLLSIDQILDIYMISLTDIEDLKLTVAEMNAMLFMIDENDNEQIIYVDEE